MHILLDIDIDGHLHVTTKLYDKSDGFNFSILNFPYLCSNIPSSPAFQMYVSPNCKSFTYLTFVQFIYHYSGASDIRTPDNRTLQFTDDFIWEQIFSYVIFSHLSGIPRSGSGRSVFTTKHRFTTNLASFNRTVKFDDTILSTKDFPCQLSFTLFYVLDPHE